MNDYILQSARYRSNYDCSMFTLDEWNAFGRKRHGFGAFNLVLGSVVLGLYLPCLKTMLEPSLWRFSCYKLMFFNGVIDVFGVFNSCFVTSFMAMQGAVFCSYPDFIYIWGCLCMALWFAQCLTAAILAFNRCVEFFKIPFFTGCFQQNRTFYWFIFPICSFIYAFLYSESAVYTSIGNMWAPDPYFGIANVTIDRQVYINVSLNVNNVFTFSILTSCYLVLVVTVWVKGRNGDAPTMTKMQRNVTIQAFLICLFIYMCAVFYVGFEFFPNLMPESLLIFSFFGWQWSFCGVVIVYLAMNASMRSGVINYYMNLFGCSRKITPAPIFTVQLTTTANDN